MTHKNSRASRRVLTLLVSSALPLLAHAGGVKDTLDEALAQQQARSDLPGFCAAIVDADGALYQNGFGFADVAAKRRYTADTVQPIASVSKTLIGVALMKAVEQGLFTLDTHVNDVLPFKVVHPRFPDRPITLRQLATHTSGIVDRAAVYEKAYEQSAAPRTSLKEFLVAYFDKKGRYYDRRNFADTAPGEAFGYSNIGAALAGYAIEAKSGMSYADYTRKFILEPARMASSGWSLDEARNDNATLYEAKGKPYPTYSLVTYPDGGLHTSCADLGRFLAQVIAGRRGGSGLLATASFEAMLAPQFDPARPPKGVDAKHPNSGIFWMFLGDGEIAHYGGDPGVSTFMAFDPKTGLGRILLANIGGEDAMTKALAGQMKNLWTTLQDYGPKLSSTRDRAGTAAGP